MPGAVLGLKDKKMNRAAQGAWSLLGAHISDYSETYS